MKDQDIQAMSDAEYEAWRLRRLRSARNLSLFAFGLSIFSLALSVWAKLDGW